VDLAVSLEANGLARFLELRVAHGWYVINILICFNNNNVCHVIRYVTWKRALKVNIAIAEIIYTYFCFPASPCFNNFSFLIIISDFTVL
ncbi:MAG TPA: hypothetical protein VE548_07680, partial [Nitrososphaeraceae archaeon]|nr:hypothetical protein [Nitrososphaeraceae archaeon]